MSRVMEADSMNLMKEVRKRAHEWVDSLSMAELFMMVPDAVFEGSTPTKTKRVVAKPAVAKTARKITVVGGAPLRNGRGGRIRKKAGNLTPEKRQVILERFGDTPKGTKEFEDIRNALCRELSLSRLQVSSFMRMSRVNKDELAANVHKMNVGRNKTRSKKKRGGKKK